MKYDTFYVELKHYHWSESIDKEDNTKYIHNYFIINNITFFTQPLYGMLSVCVCIECDQSGVYPIHVLFYSLLNIINITSFGTKYEWVSIISPHPFRDQHAFFLCNMLCHMANYVWNKTYQWSIIFQIFLNILYYTVIIYFFFVNEKYGP